MEIEQIKNLILVFFVVFVILLVIKLVINFLPRYKKKIIDKTDEGYGLQDDKSISSKDYDIEVLRKLMPQQIDFGFMQGLRFGMGFALGIFIISLLVSLVFGTLIGGVVSQMF